MNTKEVARYLGIHEKQVYSLIKERRLPATRITGKWLFPRRLIDEWIEENARSGLKEARKRVKERKGALLAAGSNDPMLDLLFSIFQLQHPDLYLFSTNLGSSFGLKALAQGYTDIAWSHLYDPSGEGYNTPAVLKPILGDMPWVVVNLFWREVSLVLRKENPLGISSLEDALKKGLKFVNRQKGSGTRLYLDLSLEKLKIAPGAVPGYEWEVFTHMEVGIAVLTGRAEAGIATTAVARLLGLYPLPLTKERFDMVTLQTSFFQPAVQALIETIRSARFEELAPEYVGYDFTESGRIMWATL